MRQAYRLFLDAHWKPGEVDGLELWQVGHLMREGEADSSAGMAVRSYEARMRGEKLTPVSATAHAVHGDAIRAALAAKRQAEAS